MRFLDFFRPIAKYLIVVKPPERKLRFTERLFWTGLVLVVFLIMSEVPLYGVSRGELGADPLFAMRVILASSRGTLMELGIGPIVTAGLILQLLAGSKIIRVDFTNPEDRKLFTVANKFLAIIVTAVEALAYLLGGFLGQLPYRTAVIVYFQLVSAGIVLILLDELIQKGWGLGSGISLFIVAGVSQKILWDSFSPLPAFGEEKALGAILAYFQAIMEGADPLLYIFARPYPNPSLFGLIVTIIIFLIVIYLEGVRVEVPMSYARFRGFRGKFPLKLLYVSSIPVILTSILFTDIYFLSQFIWSNFNRGNDNFLLNIIGTFREEEGGPIPTGGLAYYVMPIRGMQSLAEEGLRALIYTILFVTSCIAFSLTWVQVGGLDAKTVARRLIDSGMQIPGFRRAEKPIELMLSAYITPIAVLGGLTVGLIAVLADFFGAFGTGIGCLLTVSIMYQYYQILLRERVLEMYPALAKFLEKR